MQTVLRFQSSRTIPFINERKSSPAADRLSIALDVEAVGCNDCVDTT
jgi:hypothetical protein